ncbi:MAG: hypothetical protein R2831_07525 [Chitinophagaceae bacterium]
MQIKYGLFSLFIMLFLMNACKSDFKVGADYKDVTVVYGLLSISDTAQYIKVTKGYYDETKDNLLLAQIADSIYYQDLQAKLERIKNGQVIQTINLARVDANLEGFAKDSGVFANTPNYVYKTKETLDPSSTYKLVMTNMANGKVISAETGIIDVAAPAFSVESPISKFSILFVDQINSFNTFSWFTPPNAAFFDVNIRFWYQEKNSVTGASYHLYKDLPVIKNVYSSGGKVTAKMDNDEFFRALNSALGTPPTGFKRYVDTPDVLFLAGGLELRNYIDVINAQGGITNDQLKPVYTNIASNGVIGKEAFGVFSTRAIKPVLSVRFSNTSIDSILYGSYTKNLGFVGISSQ